MVYPNDLVVAYVGRRRRGSISVSHWSYERKALVPTPCVYFVNDGASIRST